MRWRIGIRRPFGHQVQQSDIVGHRHRIELLGGVGMRPVAAPDATLGRGFQIAPRRFAGAGIVGRCAAAIKICPRQLHPAMAAVQQLAHRDILRALCVHRPAQMIDDHRHRQAEQQGFHLHQLFRRHVALDMPSHSGNAPGQRHHFIRLTGLPRPNDPTPRTPAPEAFSSASVTWRTTQTARLLARCASTSSTHVLSM